MFCACSPAFCQSVETALSSLAARAAAARDRGDLAQAVDLYRQASALDPHWAEGWWFLGNLQYKLDQYAPARDSLSQYIALTPKAVAAIALRGLCEYELGQYPESLGDIEQAISLGAANQPRNAQILLYHQALLLTRLGRFEEAIDKYSAFVKQGIANEDIALGLGLAGLRMPLLPQTAQPQDLALAAKAGAAAILIINGDTSNGEAAFHTLLVTYPKTAGVHYFCAYLLLKTNADEAIEELKQELSVAPSSKPALTLLAWALELRGDYVDALPVAQQATEGDAGSANNQLVLARALLESGKADSALSHVEKALTEDPSNLEAHITLAKLYSEMGRKEEAREERLLCLKLSDKEASHAAQ